MATKSVNGKLSPVSGDFDFTAYYLLISYDQIIDSENTAFQSQRVLTDDKGNFRFFIPENSKIVENIVKIEVYAPNGTMLDRDLYTTQALKASEKTADEKDSTKKFIIKINPFEIIEDGYIFSDNKVKGRVVDILGGSIPSDLQIIIWATKDSAITTFDSNQYIPIFIGKTDSKASFSGNYIIDDYEFCFATINGFIDSPISVALQDKKIPQFILLPFSYKNESDEEDSHEDCGCKDESPRLPNSEDLVSDNGSYSNDLGGGQCNVKFKPNRTLEEVSFCAITRTTDPQIERNTITELELYEIKDSMKTIFNSIKSNFSSFETHSTKIKANVALIKEHLEVKKELKKQIDIEPLAK
ncbi:hypothetical protein [Lacinutrix sp. MEBiC02404]